MKILLKVLTAVFAICGIGAYLAGWVAVLTKSTIFAVPTDVWFLDAIATAVFAIFFLILAMHSERKR